MRNVFLFLIVSALLCGCGTGRKAAMVEHSCHDTLYISTVRYDSVYIDQWQYRDRSSDTVYVEKVRLEYRYKFLKDTVRIVRVDSIPVVREVEVTRVERHVPGLYKWSLGVCIVLFILTVVYIVWKIRF